MKSLIDACARREINANVKLVLSNRPQAPGLKIAEQAGIETAVLHHREFNSREEYDLRLVEMLRLRDINLVCLAGFMRLISAVLVRAFPNKIMNVHPALLPAFPGLHAQRQALEYGVKITGCTVHFVDEGLDSGPVILQRTLEVLPSDTEETLSERLLPLEHQTYVEAVRLFFEEQLKVDGRKVLIKS